MFDTIQMMEETSPDSCLNYSIGIADFVRDNVVAADPNKGHCLITNCASPVQLCHSISRKTMDDDHLVCYRGPQYLFWV